MAFVLQCNAIPRTVVAGCVSASVLTSRVHMRACMRAMCLMVWAHLHARVQVCASALLPEQVHEEAHSAVHMHVDGGKTNTTKSPVCVGTCVHVCKVHLNIACRHGHQHSVQGLGHR